jgi:hypothetical protein
LADYKKFCESCGEKIAFPPEYLGQQVNCPHCGVLTLLNDPAAASVPHQVPVTPAAPVAAVPEVKESLWQRFKGTIELIGGLIAIIGLGIGAWQYFKPSEEKLSAEKQYVLAHQYLEGNGTDKNVKRGGELLELAAQKGHVKSMVELGIFAKEGKAGRKKDYGEHSNGLNWPPKKAMAVPCVKLGFCTGVAMGSTRIQASHSSIFVSQQRKGMQRGSTKLG